ncbi:hypothetical protein BDV09DRAFT_202135 [Aspergillus tetrazonus]
MPTTRPSAFNWKSCPADILYLIFKLLSPAEHHTLCLVNQEFRAIAEPLLYSKIQFTWEKKLHFSGLEAPPPIAQLLETLISNPQLAAYIKSFRLDGFAWAAEEARFKHLQIHIPHDQLKEPVAFIRRSGVPYRDSWSRELCNGSVDALVALLLSQLQSLEYLYLGYTFTRQSAFTGLMLRSAVCEPGTYQLGNFQHLQELSFLCLESRDEACDRNIKNTAAILTFFYLPNLRHMSASIQNLDKWAWPAPYPPVPSKLKFLDLEIIREGSLGELLAVTKNLETLRWKWYYDFSVEDDFVTQTLDLDQIAAVLSHVRETLTELTITADCQPGVNGQFFPGLEAVGSLRALDCTGRDERLQDFMPRNVEFLTITDDLALQNSDYLEEEWPLWEWKDYAILGLLRSWLKEWTQCTPHLTRITLLLNWIDTDTNQWSPRAREQFWHLSTHYGIPLEFVDTKDR